RLGRVLRCRAGPAVRRCGDGVRVRLGRGRGRDPRADARSDPGGTRRGGIMISVAVIGAGMAGRSHAAAYRQANTVFGRGLPPIRLAAVADANLPLAEDAADRYGFEKAVSSWEAVAQDPSIDAVSIVVANAL